MIGLAVSALLGGAVIAVSRLLPEVSTQTSQATATPSVRAQPTPPARPSAPFLPVETKEVVPGPPPSPVAGAADAGWVRLRRPLAVHYKPYRTSAELYSLQAGEAAYLVAAPLFTDPTEGWMYVMSPSNGWVHADITDRTVLTRYRYRAMPTAGISSLVGGANGFVGFGWGRGHESLALMSEDGANWQRMPSSSQGGGQKAAYGPAGWLMAAGLRDRRSSAVTIRQSTDGVSWMELGSLPNMSGDVRAFVGSEAGYVLVTNGPRFWFSADGLVWTSRTVPLGGHAVRVAATTAGFYAWTQPEQSAAGDDRPLGAFSVDGWDWSPADLPVAGTVVDVVAEGDHLLAISSGPDGHAVLLGTVRGNEVQWSAEELDAFEHAAIGRVVSDGGRNSPVIVALGWDRATEAPLWWQRDGDSWRRQEMPAEFGGLPRLAAGGPRGIVAVGGRRSGWLARPVIWRLSGSSWEEAVAPFVRPLPAPTRRQCGAPPTGLVALVNMEAAYSAACFGDQPITFAGWTVRCFQCFVPTFPAPGRGDPAWLAQPSEGVTLYLSPDRVGSWGRLAAVLHPSLRAAGVPSPIRHVQVSGHFDDPAAQSCRWTPTVLEEQTYAGTAEVVARCRATFVVTEIREIAP